jgi:hypothetical protein
VDVKRNGTDDTNPTGPPGRYAPAVFSRPATKGGYTPMGSETTFGRLQWASGDQSQKSLSLLGFACKSAKVIATHPGESCLGVKDADSEGSINCDTRGPRPIYTSSPTSIVKTSKFELNATFPDQTTYIPITFTVPVNTLAAGEICMVIIEMCGDLIVP